MSYIKYAKLLEQKQDKPISDFIPPIWAREAEWVLYKRYKRKIKKFVHPIYHISDDVRKTYAIKGKLLVQDRQQISSDNKS